MDFLIKKGAHSINEVICRIFLNY
uniref:Uncharacterized protein n=1 Tax=Rhizophora mucronata TaxID=61149 RepID=A0A2P2IXC9_RHIMU